MRMSDDKKKDILINSFELLKSDYNSNKWQLSEIVKHMVEIDINTATEMWKYLLQKYENEVKGSRCGPIVGDIVYELRDKLGEDSMIDLVLGDSLLKKSIFEYAGSSTCYCAGPIIKRKIEMDEIDTANELCTLLYNNKYRTDSWYKIMDNVMPDEDISDEAYELLEMWCEKVDDKTDRAKLDIKLLKYC